VSGCAVASLLLLALAGAARAEDGGRLWLRYDPIADTARLRVVQSVIASVVIAPPSPSPTLRAAAEELQKGAAGLLGVAIPINDQTSPGAVIVGTTRSSMVRVLANLSEDSVADLGNEGFVIRSAHAGPGGSAVTVIGATTDAGALYGVFDFLRLIQTGAQLT